MHLSVPNHSTGKETFLRIKILGIIPDILLVGLQSWPSISVRNKNCVKDFHIQAQKQFASSQRQLNNEHGKILS